MILALPLYFVKNVLHWSVKSSITPEPAVHVLHQHAGTTSRVHSAPKYSNRVLNTANSSWELHLVVSKIQGGSSSFCWVVVTKIEKNKGQLQFLEQSMFTQVRQEQRKTCTEHLQQESSGGSGEAPPAPGRQIFRFILAHFPQTPWVWKDQKEGYVMVVWAAPSFSIWFSTKMSPKVNTPTMCVLRDSKKRKK